MAKSPKGSGNPLLPIAIIGVVVVAIIAGVLAISQEEAPPDEPTVIAEDSVEGDPAGAGTLPEGEPAGMVQDQAPIADENQEGITELVDDVDPAPADIESVPAADYVDSTGPDIEGETLTDEQVSDSVADDVIEADLPEEGEEPGVERVPADLTSVEEVQAGGANAEQDDEPAARIVDEPLNQTATEEILLDEETIGTDAENVDTPGPELSNDGAPVPDGRDAATDLDPSECQDIVRDTGVGGESAPFIPTPSGPDANTRVECLEEAE